MINYSVRRVASALVSLVTIEFVLARIGVFNTRSYPPCVGHDREQQIIVSWLPVIVTLRRGGFLVSPHVNLT